MLITIYLMSHVRVILPGHVTGHVTATRPPPQGHSHPRPGHVPGYVPGYVMSYVPGYVSAPLSMGTHQGPLALGHFRRPLAFWYLQPLLPFSPRPLFPRGQYPLLIMADGGLYFTAAFISWRLLAFNLRWPLAYGVPLATIGY